MSGIYQYFALSLFIDMNLTVVRLLLLGSLLLLLRCLLSSSSTASGSTTSSRGSSGTTTGADVDEHVLQVLALESLGEEGEPDGLDILDLSGSDERVDLVGLYIENMY